MTTLTAIGGPTALLEYAGIRWLTDPTLSGPGEYGGLTKTSGPAVPDGGLDAIDVILLSHDQHADNLDPAGRELLRHSRVLTTTAAVGRLDVPAEGLAPWESTTVPAPDGVDVRVTAVPAEHGPQRAEAVTGPVIGFLLSARARPSVYVSGDNASLGVVHELAERVGEVEIAILFAGAARVPGRFDGAPLTLTSADAARAALVLGSRVVVGLHLDGWTHFIEDADALRRAFAAVRIADRLIVPEPGTAVQL